MEEHLERGIALRGETKDTSIVGYNPREATVTSKRDKHLAGSISYRLYSDLYALMISSLFIIEFFLPYHDNLSRFMEFGLAVASIIFLINKRQNITYE
ncbi:hypothetical protein SCA6_012634 [Theobroma cacao]